MEKLSKIARWSFALGLVLVGVTNAEVHINLPKGDGSEVKWNDLAEYDFRTGKASANVKKLNGKTIKIPGFMIPLEDSDQSVAEFLLVPSVPSCVHVPPPPPNQIIHVKMPKGSKAAVSWKPIWVTGVLKMLSGKKALSENTYEMVGQKIEPFEY